MAPLVLEGETLGQKQRHYNQLVKAAAQDQEAELQPLNYDDPDVDNLLRIDVACSRRNVEYVLSALQSDDTLYVSRVIKRSTWLITDDQYAHIINPEYLNNELFPKISSKAKNKLMLSIRINLRNVSRVDEFFKYYSDDIKVAQKWLPNCSPATIEKVYTEHPHEITTDTFKRLCEKSINVLKILLKVKSWRYIGRQMEASKILIKKYTDEYLELLKDVERHDIPRFGVRTTAQIMHHCPEKIINNFEKFASHIHLPTFVKYLKKEDIPEFLTKQAGNEKMKNWIKYDNVKHFVKYLPIATRFEFVKKLFIDKEETSKSVRSGRPVPKSGLAFRCDVQLCSARMDSSTSSNASIYRWYRFAPFDTAFVDLKKLIRVESSPAERNAILTVLINCAKRNPEHIKTLLQFYRDKHMNEPFKFKIQFVNTLLSLTDTYKFNAATWGILNDIFTSMEVYIESENSVPYCVKAIIVYNILHSETVPKIIEDKQEFDVFKDYYKKLNEEDRDKVFSYLYYKSVSKLSRQTMNNDDEMGKACDLLGNIFTLFKEWNKNIADYPNIIEVVRYLIKTKQEKSLKCDLSHIYNIEKKWRKHMFEESLFLKPCDEVCANALRYDPGLLQRYNPEVAELCCNDAVSLKKTLRKIRIYWAQSLGKMWIEMYLEGLKRTTGHKATVEGICILLPQKRFLAILKKYAPATTKIDWSKTDNAMISLQKNIAKRIKLIRPAVPLEAVLPYAKDDYLQFVLPSLNSLMHNMSATQVSKYVPILLDSPVSLKKHGLRLAYNKLKFSEIKVIVGDVWKNTNNSSIKTVLIKETYELLKKAKKDSAIEELWQLLSIFIDNLNPDENRIIYNALGQAEHVPLLVRPQFFEKAYKYLSSLPAKANSEPIVRCLEYHAPEIMDLLEPSFVEEFLLKPVPEILSLMTDDTNTSNRNAIMAILTSYIMKSKDELTQYTRYEKYVIPLLDACFKTWKTIINNQLITKNSCTALLRGILESIESSAIKKSEIYIKMMKDIETKLRTLPLEENYCLVTYWSIAVLFAESFNEFMKKSSKADVATCSVENLEQEGPSMKGSSPDHVDIENNEKAKWEQLGIAVSPLFGKALLNMIKHDLALQIPSLAGFFQKSLMDVFEQVTFRTAPRLQTFKHLLDSELPITYIIALEGITHCYNNDEKTLKVKQEIYDIIKSHQSLEVKIHYNEAMYDNPQEFVEEAVPYLR